MDPTLIWPAWRDWRTPRLRTLAAERVAGCVMLMALAATPGYAEPERGAVWERLEVETTLETTFERLDNRDLDETTADALAVFKPELSLEIGYRFSERVSGFLRLDAERRFVVDQGRDRPPEQDESALDLKELYLDIHDLWSRARLRAGRQEFEDRREWLYDAELDGLRIFFERHGLALEASTTRENIVTENLLEKREPGRVNHYFLLARFQPAAKHDLEAFYLVFDDRSEDAENPVFLGVQGHGRVTDALDYWFALAQVRGREGSTRLRGQGFDLGATYRFDTGWTPAITVGYAFGSGDSDADDGIDRNFRQTGLQDNSYRFNGVENFRFYGETLDPELSNLSIATMGFGVRPSRRSSIDLVYHHYQQAEAVEGRLRGARVRARADGESRDLGQAVDLILGYHEISNLRLRARFGYFMPGQAFGETASDAYSVEFGVEYRF
jgi:alginate production protein